MKYKKLGTTDLDVSLICLGTMTWGTQNSEKDAFEQMDYSLSKGINFLIQLKFTRFHRLQNLTVRRKKWLVTGLRKEKLEKKLARKEQPTSGDLEDMMAYVDEFGNISETPPEPEPPKKERPKNQYFNNKQQSKN